MRTEKNDHSIHKFLANCNLVGYNNLPVEGWIPVKFHLNSFDYGRMLLCQEKWLIEQVKAQKVVTLSKQWNLLFKK